MRVEWTGPDAVVRRGEVWCPGPLPDTVWVLPDEPRTGEGRAVCVGLDGRQTAVQAGLSLLEQQTLLGVRFASESCFTPDWTARGGQLTARIAPRAPAYPEMTVQQIEDRLIVDVELPLSREDIP